MSEQVFAYGSNMCSGRFRDYGVNPQGDGSAALLVGYRLAFNKRSLRDGSGKANVEPHEGSEVWGVLYIIPETDLETLDGGEGSGYRRIRLPMRTTDGGETEAWVYLTSRRTDDAALRPYTWYKRFLVEGAREHLLPTAYIADLERIEAVQDMDEQRDRDKRALACRTAS